MHLVTSILGSADDPQIHDEVHRLDHAGCLEWLTLPRADLARRRLRATTDKGSEVAIALPRDAGLFDKAVLIQESDLIVVVRVEAERWLRLRPRDQASALALGYHAGNLHWRVRFDGDVLLVALERPYASYIDRLSDFLHNGNVAVEKPAEETLELVE